ncbi:NUDIX hydrolase [Marinobacterium sp. AK62]|uniref:Phosphatase NudJ n=1 Tax=Marinobacterium alkalitolerans TaxID=1542925 RepID=A0ABS3ZBS2_9GAMM|nr:NUDIX hydrolase [Marinobacterium alkalitolerans]MBP0049160.1 NUDIX hydrolase [Marinobacterium alkalitolerans]
MRWTPHATVACIVEREGRFLLVEEMANGERVYNQPAGHLEEGETFIDAARREALEETGWIVEPEALLGLYTYYAPANGVTYHRFCFVARAIREVPNAKLDDGIIAAHWLTRDEIETLKPRLRSKLVTDCIDDYLRGTRYPLDVIQETA